MTEGLIVLRDWLFRGFLFEADAEKFRRAGVRVGAGQRDVEATLLEEALAPFPLEMRNDALAMARVYALPNCFENSVRELVKTRLLERVGPEWWDKAVPVKVRTFVESRKDADEKESWLEGDRTELLGFAEFGHLADIIIQNWEHFEDLIPTQHFLKQRMDELEKARHYVAHNRLLLPAESQRIQMYVADWNRTVGI